ncbi:MAG: HAD-IA family hydrolase [Porphyromonadaceae bacterium]|nr:HAD-IA family hydrolase [Porphyromonadaceae bacterium]
MNTRIQDALKRFWEWHGVQSSAFRAAFFDMDGVLFDSMPAHCRSWLETAHSVGLEMSERDVYMFEGQTGSFTINLLFRRTHGRDATQQERQTIYQTKSDLFARYNSGASIPNADAVVSAMHGLARVLVTGSSQPSLLGKVQQAFPSVFASERMVTGLDVRLGKPNPEPYLMALAKVNVQPWEALVVENAPMGVRSAHAAGCFTIAVNTGPLPDDELWEQGADLVLPDMQTLLDCLPDLGIK